MVLRKINAGLSLLSTILLMVHAMFHAAWMLSQGGIEKTTNILSWVLFGLMLLHAFISIDLVVSVYAETEERKHKYKHYPQMNGSTLIQRVSGMLLIVFTVLHVAGTMGYLTPPPVVHAILPPLFFTVALMHAAVSTSKALITLGIGNARLVKTVDIAMRAICIVTLVADVVGFYLYLV